MPAFRPGQYVAVGLEVDGRPLQRPYSMASGPEDDALVLLIRPAPAAASRHACGISGPGIGSPSGGRRACSRSTRTTPGARCSLRPARGSHPCCRCSRHGWPRHRRRTASAVTAGNKAGADRRARRRASRGPRLPRAARGPRGLRPDRLCPRGITPRRPGQCLLGRRTGRVGAILAGLLDKLGADPLRTVALVCGNPGMSGSVAESCVPGGGRPRPPGPRPTGCPQPDNRAIASGRFQRGDPPVDRRRRGVELRREAGEGSGRRDADDQQPRARRTAPSRRRPAAPGEPSDNGDPKPSASPGSYTARACPAHPGLEPADGDDVDEADHHPHHGQRDRRERSAGATATTSMATPEHPTAPAAAEPAGRGAGCRRPACRPTPRPPSRR